MTFTRERRTAGKTHDGLGSIRAAEEGERVRPGCMRPRIEARKYEKSSFRERCNHLRIIEGQRKGERMLTTLEPVYCGTEADQSRDRDALARLHSSPVHGNQDVARAVDREPYLVSACGTGSARRVAYRLDVVGCWQGSKVGKDVIRRRAARAITG